MTDFSKTKSLVPFTEGRDLSRRKFPRPTAEDRHRTYFPEQLMDEWGEMLITGWNKAGWMALPSVSGDRIAKLIGATPGSVAMGDTLSIKVYQALASALEMRPERKIILSDKGNFPTDLVHGAGAGHDTLAKGHELLTVSPEAVAAASANRSLLSC